MANVQTVSLHLVPGGSAGGCVRAALSSCGLPGCVYAVDDDLSYGPLVSHEARSAYLTSLFKDDGQSTEDDDVSLHDDDVSLHDFGTLMGDLDWVAGRDVCVWAGENASERTFLQLVCHGLRSFKGSVTRVGATGLSLVPYIGAQSPDDLAALLAMCDTLDCEARCALATDYPRIRDTTGSLRRWENGRIVGVCEDYYDDLLMACVPADWTEAMRVLGQAMSRCDAHNLMSEAFLSSRLRYLAARGRIMVLDPMAESRSWLIRCR